MESDPGWIEYTMPESGNSEKATNECRRVKPRRPTDFFFLILNFCFVMTLLILFGYCFFSGSIYRQINGYDSCGNVCGLKNSGNENEMCFNPDKRNEKLLLITTVHFMKFPLTDRQCVANCSDYPGYAQNGFFCTNGKLKREIRNKFPERHLQLGSVAVALLIAIVFADIVLVLLRYATKFVVWFTVGFVAGSLVVLSFYLFWVEMMIEGIVIIAFTVLVFYLIYKTRMEIKFVIKLFKEAATVLMSMPLLLFEPLLTIFSLSIATLLCVYFVLVIDSAGSYNKELDLFEKNSVIKFTYWLNLFVFFWFVQFIVGCQHFVIAGTVSQWYFTRNKSKVRSQIRNSFSNLILFHLGTICLGSLLLTVITLIRRVMRTVKKIMRQSDNIVLIALSYVYECIISFLEGIIDFLNNNAYIVTAIDGLPLFAAGKRAVHLIFNNFGEHVATQTVGDLVIGSCKLFIFLPSFLVGFELISSKSSDGSFGMSFIIVSILAILVSHVMMSTFEITVDTLFICYSIDTEENDGELRPYFMSDNLIIAMVETKNLGPQKAPLEPQQV